MEGIRRSIKISSDYLCFYLVEFLVLFVDPELVIIYDSSEDV